MNYDEFLEAYFCLFDLAYSLSKKSWREGFLSLEKDIDPEKAAKREIFMYGMRFVFDGNESEAIEKILSNIIKHEKNTYKSLLMTIEKEAVLAIQRGDYYLIVAHLLSSYVDIPLSDPRYKDIPV